MVDRITTIREIWPNLPGQNEKSFQRGKNASFYIKIYILHSICKSFFFLLRLWLLPLCQIKSSQLKILRWRVECVNLVTGVELSPCLLPCYRAVPISEPFLCEGGPLLLASPGSYSLSFVPLLALIAVSWLLTYCFGLAHAPRLSSCSDQGTKTPAQNLHQAPRTFPCDLWWVLADLASYPLKHTSLY